MQGQKGGVSYEAILVAWVRDVGRRDGCGVAGGGDVWSKRGYILKSELMEIANGSELDVRDPTMMTNSSSHVPITALCPLQVKVHSVCTTVPGGRYSWKTALYYKMKTVRQREVQQLPKASKPIRRQRQVQGAYTPAPSLTEQL